MAVILDRLYKYLYIILLLCYIILYYIDIELQESAHGNNHFSSMLCFSLTAHWSMGISFALRLQTPETAHSGGTETEGNSGRQDFFPKSYFQQKASKTCFLELKYYVYLLGKDHNMSPLMSLYKQLDPQTFDQKKFSTSNAQQHKKTI